MGSAKEEAPAAITLLGCPLDATSSFRGGTRFAPESIRKASWTLETYSPYLKQDLEDVLFYDAGDLELRPGDLEHPPRSHREGRRPRRPEGKRF